jgi:hypothetical protein
LALSQTNLVSPILYRLDHEPAQLASSAFGSAQPYPPTFLSTDGGAPPVTSVIHPDRRAPVSLGPFVSCRNRPVALRPFTSLRPSIFRGSCLSHSFAALVRLAGARCPELKFDLDLSSCAATDNPWPMRQAFVRGRPAPVRGASHPSHAPSCACTIHCPHGPCVRASLVAHLAPHASLVSAYSAPRRALIHVRAAQLPHAGFKAELHACIPVSLHRLALVHRHSFLFLPTSGLFSHSLPSPDPFLLLPAQ